MIAIQAATPWSTWPASIAAALALLALWVSDRWPSALTSGIYLGVGALCTYWFAVVLLSQVELVAVGGGIALILPKIALVLIGGSGAGVVAALAWCSAGYLAAELATTLAALKTGGLLSFAPGALTSYLIIVFVLCLVAIAKRRIRLAQPNVDQAEEDEQLAATRYRIEVRAAAMVHDTVLNHLAAIAGSSEDALSAMLAKQITKDIEILSGEEWLAEVPPAVNENTSLDWRAGELSGAVLAARELGLEVEVTGDVSVVSRLSPEVSVALTRAVTQCLVNVVKHAGTNHAEIAVYGSAEEVSVMVIDTGKGFVFDDVAPDRLGIRNSVQGRISAVGGSVQIWSTLGRGTSILIRVPASAVHIEGEDEPLPGLAFS